ncbi:hypothetical protein H9I45_08580 [Polaribacter haliotis]|uniref:Uncharacterized protein n=1 Tax=Polaribacter haliotis TaxID=1888915 RepID=A0A7L8ABP0_9FLAO|nr:hypothetical protein [Polaribacter haliotis]QOD59428.1 hypothetical protein H9I45_08580 [Polaribacter haliotis]
METKNYKIVDSNSDLDVIMEDYNELASSFSFKYLKVGVLGTALLCSSPSIYANESKSYNIKQEIQDNSLGIVSDCDNLINEFIESVNNFQKIRFTKKEVIQDILSFKSLVNNWDGYKALPLEIESASNTIYLINLLDDKIVGSLDDLYPNPHGTISFEWTNKLNEKVYLEVGNESFSYFAKFNSSEPLFFDNLEISDENIEMLAKYIRAV